MTRVTDDYARALRRIENEMGLGKVACSRWHLIQRNKTTGFNPCCRPMN